MSYKLQVTSYKLQPARVTPVTCHVSLFSAFLLFCFLFSGCTKVKREFYDNGRLKSETHYRFGKETGTTTYYHHWYPTRIMEIEMKRGKRNGKFTQRFFNNNIEISAFYKNDLLEGTESHFYMNGDPSMVINYTKGIKNGPVTSWYGNGVVKESGFYVDGLFDGKWENYDERGMLIGEGSFEKGAGKQMIYDEMGRLQRESNFVNNKKEGVETHFDALGNIIKTILFKEDRMIEINGIPIDSL